MWEYAGVLTGIMYVVLSARANVWCWPVGLVNASLYVVIFYQAKLYADMGLQAVYFGLGLYGIYEWLRGGTGGAGRRIARVSPNEHYLVAGAGIIGCSVLLFCLTRYTDASVPWADCILTTMSLCATWLMARKFIEHWVWWIIADVLYVPLFLSKNLAPTAALYLAFAGVAFYGLRTWRKLHVE